jgi:alkylation response protein AidB-like acyl-CoA dehydrogenase
MQALGGYGYIAEYEVEKIKRDVKITCIYEGTSEIQQNIVSTFRWKTTRKTGGKFYGNMAEEMEALHSRHDNVGARFYGLAAKTLNELINRAHDSKLIKQQYVMFSLSDLMTSVEVGISLARKAARHTESQAADSEKLRAMSRIFACEVSSLAVQTSLKLLCGTGVFGPETIGGFIGITGCDQLNSSYADVVKDMDRVADILFERTSS